MAYSQHSTALNRKRVVPQRGRTVDEESFNEWGECRKFVPVLGRDDRKIAPGGNIFDQPSVKMS